MLVPVPVGVEPRAETTGVPLLLLNCIYRSRGDANAPTAAQKATAIEENETMMIDDLLMICGVWNEQTSLVLYFFSARWQEPDIEPQLPFRQSWMSRDLYNHRGVLLS